MADQLPLLDRGDDNTCDKEISAESLIHSSSTSPINGSEGIDMESQKSMIVETELWLMIIISFAARLLIIAFGDPVFNYLRPMIYNYDIQSECMFLSTNQLNTNSVSCSHFFKRNGIAFNQYFNIVSILQLNSLNIIQIEMLIQILIIVIIVVMKLRKMDITLWHIYIHNPLLLIGGIVRPFSSILHLQIIMLSYLTFHVNILLLVVSIYVSLAYTNIAYITLLPFILHIYEHGKIDKINNNNSIESTNNNFICSNKYVQISFYLIILSILIAFQYDIKSFNYSLFDIKSFDYSSLDINYNNIINYIYAFFQPAYYSYEPMCAGIWWYLRIEVFKEYLDYYRLLLAMQSFIFMFPLFLCFNKINSFVGVSINCFINDLYLCM